MSDRRSEVSRQSRLTRTLSPAKPSERRPAGRERTIQYCLVELVTVVVARKTSCVTFGIVSVGRTLTLYNSSNKPINDPQSSFPKINLRRVSPPLRDASNPHKTVTSYLSIPSVSHIGHRLTQVMAPTTTTRCYSQGSKRLLPIKQVFSDWWGSPRFRDSGVTR